MLYIGVDIIEINRISKTIDQWGDKFLARIFTTAELELYHQKTESLAARFAAKEAVLKLLGKRDTGISWQDIEVLSEKSGKPAITLRGKALAAAQELAVRNLQVSLSHSEVYAVAFAAGEA